MLASQKTETRTNPVSALYHALNEPMQQVNNLILLRLSSSVPLVTVLANHLIVAGGKRIRPLLALASYKLFSNKPSSIANLAAAVELIHTATLLHDDVVDDASTRRGQETANTVWGNNASVLVGDFLFSRAFELMVETNNLGVLACLSKASARISEGEVLQLTHLGGMVPFETYLEIISSKTAALFEAACESGALLADAHPNHVTALKDFGFNLGVTFQMMDDVLDYTSSASVSGKQVGADFFEGKVTLPALVAYDGDHEKEFWQDVFSKDTRTEIDWQRAQKIIKNYDIIQKCKDTAQSYAQKAQKSLDGINIPLASLLVDVAADATERHY